MKFHPYLVMVIGGALSALLYFNALVLSGASFLGHLAPLPILLAGFGYGLLQAAGAAGLATALVMVFLGLEPGFHYLVSMTLPSLVLVRQGLLHHVHGKKTFWYPEGRLAADVVGVMALCVFVASLWVSSIHATQKLQQEWQNAGGMVASQMGNPEVAVLMQNILHFMASHYFGVAGFLGGVMLLLNFGLAHGLLRRARMMQRRSMKLAYLDLPWWPWVAGALLGVGAVAFSGVLKVACLNALMTLGFLFLLQGLSIIHHFREKRRFSNLFLWFFYGLMLVFSWPVIVITLIGVFEPWLRLHQRIERSQE
ncbi:MAG: DUF2232 domain-containing protein [Holosporales bacterium]